MAVLLVLASVALAAAPSAAVGPSIALSVTPQTVKGYPGPDAAGTANFSGVVDLFSDPVGQATVVVEMHSQLGWPVTPPGFTWRTTTSGRFPFEFTVEVPQNATADLSDSIDVTASYRLGGVVAQSESTTVHAVAGTYYLGSARRITAPAVMEVGKTYLIEYDLLNAGNAPATFTFTWADAALNSKIRAAMQLPQSASLGGFTNETIQFLVTPGTTTPAGAYKVPVQAEMRDRNGGVMGIVNLTIDMEFTNNPIFQGLLPNWDLRGPYTLGAYAFLFLVAWFALQVGVALVAARGLDPAGGPRFSRALGVRMRKSLLVRGARKVMSKLPRARVRAHRPKRPDEVRGAAGSRAGRGR